MKFYKMKYSGGGRDLNFEGGKRMQKKDRLHKVDIREALNIFAVHGKIQDNAKGDVGDILQCGWNRIQKAAFACARKGTRNLGRPIKRCKLRKSTQIHGPKNFRRRSFPTTSEFIK